jgi:hypothetical protein
MKTAILGLFAVACLATPAGAADTVVPPAGIRLPQSGWNSLESTLPGVELVQASYHGTGLTTGHEYQLHLMKFLSREGSFIAVAEDLDMHNASIGFLKEQSPGVYSWYGMKRSEDKRAIEAPLDFPPLAQLSIEQNVDGHPSRLMLVSLVPEAHAEAVQYTDLRMGSLLDQVPSGRYDFPCKSSITYLATDRMKGVSSPLVAQWRAQILTVAADGSTSSATYFARPELPGVFALRQITAHGYVEGTSEEVSRVAVVLREPSGFWHLWHTRIRLIDFVVDEKGFFNDRAVSSGDDGYLAN